MKRPKRTTVHRHARTGFALFDLARTAGEMATAAAQTIHDRTQRMPGPGSARVPVTGRSSC